MKNLCNKFNITQSFSEKGCHYDNACIESFHAILKKEEIYRNISLGYKTPNEIEFEALNVA